MPSPVIGTILKFTGVTSLVALSRTRRHIAASLFLLALLVALTLSFVLARVYEESDEIIEYFGNSTDIQGDSLTIDTISGTFTVQWEVLSQYCQDPTQHDPIVNIYSTEILLKGKDGNGADTLFNKEDGVYTLQVNQSNLCFPPVPAFRSVHPLEHVFEKRRGVSFTGPPSLRDYPFDKYSAEVFLYATRNITGSPVTFNVTVSSLLPANFVVKLDRESSRVTNFGVLMFFDISRRIADRVFVACMVAGNWVIALIFLWITVAAFVWPEDVVREMFVLPITVLFAFVSVRASMPGAPVGFGARIDSISILPNIILIIISTAFLLIIVLIRRASTLSKQPLNLQPQRNIAEEVKAVLAALDAAQLAVNVAITVARAAVTSSNGHIMVPTSLSTPLGTAPTLQDALPAPGPVPPAPDPPLAPAPEDTQPVVVHSPSTSANALRSRNPPPVLRELGYKISFVNL